VKADVLKRILHRYLMAGLLVWIPILTTVLAVRFILDLMDKTLVLLPPALRPQALFGVGIPGFGALLAFVLLLLTGMLVSNFIGRSLVGYWDEMLNRIPFVRAIYGGVKNFSNTLLSGSGNSFKKVMLIEYPGKGIWSIGFQTAAEVPIVSEQTGEAQVCVFIPTTPNPTSGFIVMVPRSRAIELQISIDEAMKMIVTLGVVMPSPHGLPLATPAAAPLATATLVATAEVAAASAPAAASAATSAVASATAAAVPGAAAADIRGA
jgi:uncharacterized membrane protein